ncbi:hypothetical protein [Sphingomonas sp. ID1715]|uniref:hypothetical protein n=1 Tax=Sphingomonas sp. ID1715 TaxID=1656898 RepID=UPI001489CFCE|nr:hypothetical protein [Sphingomonas sp. ID1715]
MTTPKKPKKPKNLARYLARNFRRISKEFNARRPSTLEGLLRLVAHLRDDIRGYDLDRDERASRLFAFGSWDDLSMFVLQGRFLPLPEERLPRSEAELLALCQNLLDRTGDQTLRNRFVRGWSGEDFPEPALEAFSKKLWATARNDPKFFATVVRGYHGSALAYLVEERVPMGLRADQALGLIYKMALIWGSHDVQATTALARLSMTRPFGWLIQGSAQRMMASTVFTVWRPVHQWLSIHLDRYRTNEETWRGKPEGKPTRHDDVKTIRAAAAPLLFRSELGRSKRSERDVLAGDLREFISTEGGEFWDELRESTGRFDNRQMSQEWYSDLTPVQMVAVAAIRLIHLEAVLGERLATTFERALRGQVRPELDLPVYQQDDLPRGWKERAKLLIDDLRRAILDDVDHQSRRPDGEKGESDAPAHDETFIEAALEFLDAAMQEVMPNDPDSLAGRRQTLALINVAAAARFQR